MSINIVGQVSFQLEQESMHCGCKPTSAVSVSIFPHTFFPDPYKVPCNLWRLKHNPFMFESQVTTQADLWYHIQEAKNTFSEATSNFDHWNLIHLSRSHRDLCQMQCNSLWAVLYVTFTVTFEDVSFSWSEGSVSPTLTCERIPQSVSQDIAFTLQNMCFVKSQWPLTFGHQILLRSSLTPSECKCHSTSLYKFEEIPLRRDIVSREWNRSTDNPKP